MGATKGSWSGRAVFRVLSALALLVAVMAAAPGSRAGAAEKTPPGDPPGNNGTIKIVASDPSDPDPGNEPMADSCLIWLEFYGFDQGQTADITFTAQPPSGTQQLIVDPGVPISDDAAGGGQDKDAVLAYNLTSAVGGLKAQRQHGYHIKVRSDSKEAPGGAKQKVFGVKCAPAPATALHITKAVQGTGAGPFAFELRCNHRVVDRTFTLQAGETHDVTGVPAGTTCVTTETDTKGATSTKVAETPPDGAADGRIKLAAGKPATVAFTNVFPGAITANQSAIPSAARAAGGTTATGTPATGPQTSVLGENVTRPGSTPQGAAALPRTGGDPAPLAAAGLWSLSAGSLALAAGRRRRRS